jgi:hypothetical protein
MRVMVAAVYSLQTRAAGSIHADYRQDSITPLQVGRVPIRLRKYTSYALTVPLLPNKIPLLPNKTNHTVLDPDSDTDFAERPEADIET